MTGHLADSHDLIRVQGARENNLKDVSVELPKRRLTVFTGVSGSGKSSLVFATIAAESQRMINETYSAFVQGFMPSLGAPRGRLPRGPDDRDHRRPGADGRQPALDGRHRHRRQRDAADPLQPARHAVRRPAHGVLLQRARPARPAASMSTEKGGRIEKKRGQGRRLPRRHVPALRGHGQRQRHRPDRALRRLQVAERGRADDPGLLDGRVVRPALRGRRPADGQADRVVHQEAARHDALRRADQDQGRGHQPHLRRHHPQDPEVDAVQGPRGDAAARTPLRRARRHLPALPRVRAAPG